MIGLFPNDKYLVMTSVFQMFKLNWYTRRNLQRIPLFEIREHQFDLKSIFAAKFDAVSAAEYLNAAGHPGSDAHDE